jgi:hypothetical protein
LGYFFTNTSGHPDFGAGDMVEFIFLGTTYQNGKNIPINHKIYQMGLKYIKWP